MARDLPKKAVEEFIAIYQQEFNNKLDQTVGKEKAEKVYIFFKTLIELCRQSNNLTRKGVHLNEKK